MTKNHKYPEEIKDDFIKRRIRQMVKDQQPLVRFFERLAKEVGNGSNSQKAE